MLIRDIQDCAVIIAGDRTVLREILHPEKDAVSLGFSLAHAAVLPGESSLPHRLKSSEVYYILSGEGNMYINEASHLVRSGQTVYIPPDAVQWIRNTGTEELSFLCIVDPAWRPKDEKIL